MGTFYSLPNELCKISCTTRERMEPFGNFGKNDSNKMNRELNPDHPEYLQSHETYLVNKLNLIVLN